jgi:hypothetical protein
VSFICFKTVLCINFVSTKIIVTLYSLMEINTESALPNEVAEELRTCGPLGC